MKKIIMVSPKKYIQGPNILTQIGRYINFAKKALLVGDKMVLSIISKCVVKSLYKEKIQAIVVEFRGENTSEEIKRIKKIAKREKIDTIIGAGGGKAIDTAKAIGYYLNIPIVTVPTIASTDAPTSSISVLYTKDHTIDKTLFTNKNPDLVLVDTKIILNAPSRYLVAGIGDAISKKFEVEACIESEVKNIHRGYPPEATLTLARLIYDILIKYGLQAKRSVELQIATPALEKVVEATILLGGLVFENGGLAVAHAIHDGFTILEKTHQKLHGELVAFGTIVQMIMESRPEKEITNVLNYCSLIGLPITLKELGLESTEKEKLFSVAKRACAPNGPIHNMPFPIDSGMVYKAILSTDKLGRKIKRKKSKSARKCEKLKYLQ